MIIYYKAAVPSLLSLAVLCFLPWSCRRSHTFWRAVQAYDKQPSSIDANSPRPKASLRNVMAVLGVPITMLVLMTFVAVTAGGDWHNGWPILANTRDAVPRLFLIYFVYRATSSISATLMTPLLQFSRIVGADGSELLKLTRLNEDGQPHTKRNRFAIDLIVSLVIVWTLRRISSQSPIVLAMTSSCVVLVTELNTIPLIASKHSSFRGFLLVPLACLAYQGIILLMTQALVYFLGKFFDDAGKNPAIRPDNDRTSWGVGKMFEDVDAMQSFLLLSSILFSLAAWFTCALVALAYRFDMAQEGVRREEEADPFVAHSVKSVDTTGRTPILFNEVALCPSKTKKEQLPTFHAAHYAMIGIQVFGTAFDVLTGWQPGVFFPTRTDQLPPVDDNPFSVNIWPLVAYPFVIIAMIISVQRQPNRSFRTLWSYNERWHPESSAMVKSTDVQGEEELELGKRSDESGSPLRTQIRKIDRHERSSVDTGQITISLACEEDSIRLSELMVAAYEADETSELARLLYPPLPPKKREERNQENAKGFHDVIALGKQKIIKAMLGDVIVGVAMWIPPGEDWLRTPRGDGFLARYMRQLRKTREEVMKGKQYWYLALLAVDPGYWSHGIGTSLVQWGLDRAQNGAVECCYLESSDMAQPLYTRMGFEIIGWDGIEEKEARDGFIKWPYMLRRRPQYER